MGTTARVRDDRGREVPSAVAGVNIGARHSDLLDRSRARAIERSAGGGSAIRLSLVALLIAAPAFLLPAIYVNWMMPTLIGRIGMALSIALAAPLGAAGPIVMGLSLRWMMRQRVARAYVSAGFCGACGFSLEAMAADADGCTVCPECGAAWRAGAS